MSWLDLPGRSPAMIIAGVALIAFAAALPEVSTILESIRLRQYEMAFSDISGTHLFDLALPVLANGAYRGGPVLWEAGNISLLAAPWGIVVASIVVAGLVNRRSRTVVRMGTDSLALRVAYGGGLPRMYQQR